MQEHNGRKLPGATTQSNYLFGAVCPERGAGAALVLPACNCEAMQLHLDEIATKVAPGAHAIILLDQAGWHTAKALVVPSNVSPGRSRPSLRDGTWEEPNDFGATSDGDELALVVVERLLDHGAMPLLRYPYLEYDGRKTMLLFFSRNFARNPYGIGVC
jgi:hypothetical protein